MNGSGLTERLTEEALEQHRQIHFYLDQISATLDQLDGEAESREAMGRLAAQIDGFMERLQEHHQLEEKRGLFRMILEVLPEARVEISRLVKQHQRIIEILEMARLHAVNGKVEDAPELRDDLRSFVEMFRNHERSEELLIRQAIARESGTLR